MLLFDNKEFDRVKSKYYDPGNPITKLVYKDPKSSIRFHLGFIDDNKDPDKMCRVKVRFPQWGDEVISDWVSLVRPFGGADMGFGIIPEIDEQVVCCFINDNSSKPLVLGSLYNTNNKPDVEDNKKNNFKILTSKSGSRIELHEKDGKEKIVISMKDEKMMLVVDKEKGINIINDLGDINIKCKKLVIDSQDDASLKINKSLTMECRDDKMTYEMKRTCKFTASTDAVIKGTKVKLEGDLLTASNMIVAKKGDLVVGVDTHNVWIPAGNSEVMVPMPHNYNGELCDMLSQDVEVKGKAIAVKGSKSKFTKPGHIAMGTRFNKTPNNEGEVGSGTIATVKVNDKEIAVIGSMVKTCDDMGNLETSSILPGG